MCEAVGYPVIRLVRVRIERVGQTCRRVEPSDEAARLSADAPEFAGGQNLSIRLHRNFIHLIVRVRVKGGVERAVRV